VADFSWDLMFRASPGDLKGSRGRLRPKINAKPTRKTLASLPSGTQGFGFWPTPFLAGAGLCLLRIRAGSGWCRAIAGPVSGHLWGRNWNQNTAGTPPGHHWDIWDTETPPGHRRDTAVATGGGATVGTAPWPWARCPKSGGANGTRVLAVDLRDTCPCYNNFMKKSIGELCTMLISAYRNQLKVP